MIHGLALDVADIMAAKLFPVRVFYGPERTHHENFSDMTVVFERDRDASDSFASAQGQVSNSRKKRTRYLAAKATIYARSSLPGAHVGNHENLCEQLVDGLLCAIENWGVQARAGDVQLTDGRYVKSPEGYAPGVVYELKFRVGRGVFDADFNGAGRITGAAAHVAGTVNATSGSASESTTLPRHP